MGRTLGAVVVAVAAIAQAQAFYLPGVAPQDYARDDVVNIKVNKLSSTKTQLPYEYYSLPFCRPNPVINSAENLGEVLRGDRIENSLYQLEMRLDEQCKVVCKLEGLTAKQSADYKGKIEDEYRVNMILDNLPVAMVKMREEAGQPIKTYERGYPIGFKAAVQDGGAEKYFLHNHVRFNILYHKDIETDLSRIVGFEVEPFSVKHEYEQPWDPIKPRLDTCSPSHMQYVTHGLAPQIVEEGEEVIFTYDIFFKMSDIRWASRWDTYLLMTDDQIHWFSIINSLMIVLFLSGMVALIMLRTLHRDISKYNQLETAEEALEETGWKLVHGDVFRAPKHPNTLAVVIGSGAQLLSMSVITLGFAVLGFLSPANRGGLMTAMLLLFVFMGVLAGYVSSRLYKSFNGIAWKRNTILTSLMFPGVVFFVFFVLNFFVWGKGSSGAVPFGTLFALLFLWFGISVPLCFVGSYFGFRKKAMEFPVRTNMIPRQIPDQPWYMQGLFAVLVGGILPFGAVFIELFFILSSVWLNQFYYVFGFLGLVFVILLITCSEISIVLCYFQLCSEDYNWWWRAFLTSGSSGVYLFIYGIFYFSSKLDISGFTSTLLYFGYMFMASYAFAIGTGTVGFLASFYFVQRIYGSIKVD